MNTTKNWMLNVEYKLKFNVYYIAVIKNKKFTFNSLQLLIIELLNNFLNHKTIKSLLFNRIYAVLNAIA